MKNNFLFKLVMGIILGLSILLITACTSSYTGSSTIIGEQFILPEITDTSDNLSVRIYESVKGARVWTAKDSRVTVKYTNSYTNEYFGIVTKQDATALYVEVEPLSDEYEEEPSVEGTNKGAGTVKASGDGTGESSQEAQR